MCSVCFYICDLNLEVIEKFQANKTVRPDVLHTRKVCTIRPWKFPWIHTEIFGRMESAQWHFPFGEKFRFEFLEISIDEWKSIFWNLGSQN